MTLKRRRAKLLIRSSLCKLRIITGALCYNASFNQYKNLRKNRLIVVLGRKRLLDQLVLELLSCSRDRLSEQLVLLFLGCNRKRPLEQYVLLSNNRLLEKFFISLCVCVCVTAKHPVIIIEYSLT